MKPNDIPKELNTLGDHLKKQRLTLALFQKDVALLLGVNEWTYHKWETNKTEPIISMYPKVIEFLGYDPFPEPQTVGERFYAYRRRGGISVQRLAEKFGVNEKTLSRWEKGETQPDDNKLKQLRNRMID